MGRTVIYSDEEKGIVGKGLAAVQEVLEGKDTAAKERLLFCLDYYMDPYYGNRLSYEEELVELLQQVIISPNPLTVKEDALQLLTDYGWPPFPVLGAGFHLVEKELRGDVQYALNMGREQNLIWALLLKCRQIFGALSEDGGKLDDSIYGTMPKGAVVKYCGEENGPAALTWKMDRDGQTVVDNEVRHAVVPVTGMYYPEAAFWIHCGPELETGFLSYQMGPRFGRGFKYETVETAEGSVELVNEQTLWVS